MPGRHSVLLAEASFSVGQALSISFITSVPEASVAGYFRMLPNKADNSNLSEMVFDGRLSKGCLRELLPQALLLLLLPLPLSNHSISLSELLASWLTSSIRLHRAQEVKKREAAKAKRERSTAVKEKKAAKKKGSTPASKTKVGARAVFQCARLRVYRCYTRFSARRCFLLFLNDLSSDCTYREFLTCGSLL